MRKKLSILLCGALAVGMLTACGGETETSDAQVTNSETGEKESVSEADETVTIWHDGDETIMGVIADTVNDKLAAEHVSVKFEKKTGLTDQLKL